MKKLSVHTMILSAVSFIFAVGLCTFLTLFLIACSTIKSSTENKFAVIEDSIFDAYFKDINSPENFSLISFSDYARLENNKKKSGPFASVIAFVSKKDSINLEPSVDEGELIKSYPLESKNFFPSIPADFNDGTSIDSATLSITVSDLKNLPEKNRALPIDGKYAGDENYALEKKSYAVCSVLIPEYSSEAFEFFDAFFADKSKPDSKTTFVSSVGDLMLERGVQEILMYEKDGLETVFGDTLPILRNNDITIGNLEGVVTESNRQAHKTYVFKFHKAVLAELKKAGFNYLMQTNNHCYDYGEEGFKDTLAALAEYEIPTSGIGYNDEEAKKFYHTTINGINFAIISCGAYPVERSGFNGQKTASAKPDRAGILWQDEELIENIRKEKEAGNFVIVNVHGGEEYVKKPTKSQRELYERFIDSGADLVLGSHPHVIQPTEWYNGKLIVYSLGNFIFNKMGNMAAYGALDTEIVRIGIIDGKITYAEIYPAKINGPTVNLKNR